MPRSVLQFQLPVGRYLQDPRGRVFAEVCPAEESRGRLIIKELRRFINFPDASPARRLIAFPAPLPEDRAGTGNDSNRYSCNPCRRWYQDNLQSRPGYLQLLQYNAPPRQRCMADLCDVYTCARLLIRLSDNSPVPRHDRSTASRCLKVKLLFVR